MWSALLGSWTQDFCLFKELCVLLQTLPGLRAEHASAGGKMCREKLLTTFSSPFFPLCWFFLSSVCGSAVPISMFMKWLAFVRTYQVINHIGQEIHSQEIHDPYSSSCLHKYGLCVHLIPVFFIGKHALEESSCQEPRKKRNEMQGGFIR